MNFPDNLKYSKDHEWIRIEGDQGTIGITEFAQGELGDIVYVDIPSSGKKLGKNEVFGTVEAVKTVSDLFMPLAGTVKEINSKLEKSPDLVNKDPYGEGWMIRITLSDASDLSGLMDAAEYAKITGSH